MLDIYIVDFVSDKPLFNECLDPDKACYLFLRQSLICYCKLSRHLQTQMENQDKLCLPDKSVESQVRSFHGRNENKFDFCIKRLSLLESFFTTSVFEWMHFTDRSENAAK